jgi:hypothetical protein
MERRKGPRKPHTLHSGDVSALDIVLKFGDPLLQLIQRYLVILCSGKVYC